MSAFKLTECKDINNPADVKAAFDINRRTFTKMGDFIMKTLAENKKLELELAKKNKAIKKMQDDLDLQNPKITFKKAKLSPPSPSSSSSFSSSPSPRPSSSSSSSGPTPSSLPAPSDGELVIDEQLKLTMLKKEKLVAAGVTVPGFSSSHEIKKPMLVVAKDGKKNIYLIITGIFTPQIGGADLGFGPEELKQDIRGGILGLKPPPLIPNENMASYWADFCMDNLPEERKFSTFEDCKLRCGKLFPDADLSEVKVLENLIIILGAKPFQSLGWITVGKRTFRSLETDEEDVCKKTATSPKFSSLFTKSCISEIIE